MTHRPLWHIDYETTARSEKYVVAETATDAIAAVEKHQADSRPASEPAGHRRPHPTDRADWDGDAPVSACECAPEHHDGDSFWPVRSARAVTNSIVPLRDDDHRPEAAVARGWR